MYPFPDPNQLGTGALNDPNQKRPPTVLFGTFPTCTGGHKNPMQYIDNLPKVAAVSNTAISNVLCTKQSKM